MSKEHRLVIMGGGVLGWLTMAVWSFFSYKNSGSSCNLLSCFNIADFSGGVFFYLLFLFSLGFSGFYAYKFLIQTNKMSAPENKNWFVAVSGIFLLAAFLAPSLNTHDISFYFSAGKAVNQGFNVFTDKWPMVNVYISEPSVQESKGIMYGPITIKLFAVLYKTVRGNAFVFVMIWKFFMAICSLITLLLMWKIIHVLYPKPVEFWKLALFWFCQPLLIWQWVGNGQFDALWLIFVLMAILFSIKKRWSAVIVFLTIGIWIKFIPVLMAPWFVLWWWQDVDKSNWKKSALQVVVGLTAGVFITVVSWEAFWGGLITLQPIAMQTKWAIGSIFSVLYFSLKPVFYFLFGANVHWLLTRLIHLIVGVGALYLVYPVIKKGFYILIKKSVWQPVNYINAIFISMLIYLSVWQKSFWPWYVAWLLPFGLITFLNNGSIVLKKILVWISFAPLFFYALWAVNHAFRNTDGPGELWFQWVVVCVMWIYPLAQLYIGRKSGYELPG